MPEKIGLEGDADEDATVGNSAGVVVVVVVSRGVDIFQLKIIKQ